MTRLSAFATHLGISFIIFLALAYLVVFHWYPGILFDADGGWRGMQIIFAVDLVLGPMLTLAVFKPGKPGLKTDMTFIGLLQTVCLIAGTYVVWADFGQGMTQAPMDAVTVTAGGSVTLKCSSLRLDCQVQ